MRKAVDKVGKTLRGLIPPRSETSALGVTVLLAALVGVLAGVLALWLNWSIPFLHRNLVERLSALPPPWRYGLVCLLPAAFLAAGWVARRWAPEVQGTGIDQVMSAVGRGGGYLRKRVIALKPLLTALCIGAGAPLGMEGPVVQTGGAVGSLVGRRAKLGVGNIRTLVAAGAAAALAAKYGAPIGGAVFSAELILGGAGAGALLPLIVASFAAVITRFSLFGAATEYAVAELPTFGGTDYAMFALLGALAGVAATYFIKLIFATEDFMRRQFSQWWARALFGGLLVGLVGAMAPDLLGTGHATIQHLLQEPETALRLLLVFVLLKPLFASAALGSGASGGVFAPALFTGAALGALFHGVAEGAPGIQIASSPAYALVGMAAVMGAVMRAPLQAILITFELTRDYSAIPALMIACVLSIKVSELFEPESAFTRRLVRTGVRLARGMDYALLDDFAVRDVMNEQYVALPADADIGQIGVMVRESQNRTFPVVEEQNRPVGIVMLATLVAAAQGREGGDEIAVRDLLEPELVSLSPDDSLLSAWRTMGNYDYDCLPVCRRADRAAELVGICEKEAVVELHDRQAFVQMTRSGSE